jgi:hypothetical protein
MAPLPAEFTAAPNPFLGGHMYRTTSALATLVLAATLSASLSGVRNASASTTATAEPFWRCPSGYSFETSGSAVHCKKPAWTETKPFMPCGVPTPTFKLDLVGYTDMCAGDIGVTVTAEPMCYPTDIASGFTKRTVSGKDFCGKSHPAEVISPNVLITL